MDVDIYIKERSGSREIRVPWLPAQIKYESGGTIVATYDILNNGSVAVPSGTGLGKISWDSQFPGENRTDDGMMRGRWRKPSYYHKILERWREKGTPLNLMVTGYPINMDVILEDYSASPAGGFGDMEYSVSFIEDLDITIKTKKNTTKKNEDKKRPAEKTTAYTIKKGDTLWAIAQRFLGSGTKWQTIYNANKTIIESTAKKYGKSSSDNGHWIYPGVTIQIPDASSTSNVKSSKSSKSTPATTQTLPVGTSGQTYTGWAPIKNAGGNKRQTK